MISAKEPLITPFARSILEWMPDEMYSRLSSGFDDVMHVTFERQSGIGPFPSQPAKAARSGSPGDQANG
jgi:hypothetical protein